MWNKIRPAVAKVGSWLWSLLLIAVGSALIALAVNVFLDPNDVVPGGFTALAMFANRLWGWPVGITLLAMNLPFIALGMWAMGVRFGPRTLAAVAISSLAIDWSAPLLPTVTGDPMLYVLYGGLLYGAGIGLIFRTNATTGGTEIPAKLLEKWFHVRVAHSLLLLDSVILLIAGYFFGLAPALYALIAAWVMARVVDFIEMGWNASLSAMVVTVAPDMVRSAILQELDRGVTLLRAEGGYTGTERTVLYTVINRRQASRLRAIVSQADPHAFMVINQSKEVLGEGFTPLPLPRSRLGFPEKAVAA